MISIRCITRTSISVVLLYGISPGMGFARKSLCVTGAHRATARLSPSLPVPPRTSETWGVDVDMDAVGFSSPKSPRLWTCTAIHPSSISITIQECDSLKLLSSSLSLPLPILGLSIFPTLIAIMTKTRLRFMTTTTRVSNNKTPTRTSTVTATTTLRGGSSLLLAVSPILPPPSVAWILPALSCATCYALYNLFIKKASNSMDPILGGVLLQFVAACIGTLLWVTQKCLVTGSTSSPSTTTGILMTRSGILWSVAAGVAVGAAEILSFIVSGKGVPATQSIPIIVGGSIVVGTVLGAIWLQERMTRTGWFGVILIAAGIALVGMEGIGGH